MRIAGRLPLLLALACALSSPGGLTAGETRDLLRNPGEGAEITASAWLTAVPDQGCFPIRLSARNDAPAARQWQVTATAQSGYRDVTLASQTALRADARSASLREFMIPVTAGRQGNAPSVTLAVTGPASDGSSASWNSGRWGDRTEFVAMAESLAVLGWGPLEKWLEKPPAPTPSRNLAGCKVTPAGAPTDWRGYSGLGSLWITLEDWDASGGEPINEAEFYGRECFIGLDLSSKFDITASVLMFPPATPAEQWVVIPRFWIPGDTARKKETDDRVPYLTWARQGYVRLTDGNAVDYTAVKQAIADDAKRFKVREVAYDPWNATHLALQLQDEGCNVIEYQQSMRAMSEPTKELEKLVRQRRIRHGGNPVLRWMASHVSVIRDSSENMKPTKKNPNERIDGIVAMIMALGRASLVTKPEPEVQLVII